MLTDWMLATFVFWSFSTCPPAFSIFCWSSAAWHDYGNKVKVTKKHISNYRYVKKVSVDAFTKIPNRRVLNLDSWLLLAYYYGNAEAKLRKWQVKRHLLSCMHQQIQPKSLSWWGKMGSSLIFQHCPSHAGSVRPHTWKLGLAAIILI